VAARAQKKALKYSPRIWHLFILFTVILLVLSARLVQLQVVDSAKLSAQAKEQRISTITLTAHRGTIYDVNGTILATDIDVKTVAAHPYLIEDKEAAAIRLAGVLGEDPDYWQEMFEEDDTFVYLAKKVDVEVGEEVEELGITGIEVFDDVKRSYPYGSVAGTVVGVVGSDGEGLSGLELEYNDVLKGTDGTRTRELGEGGIPIVDGYYEEEPAQDGKDIVVSIDIELQAGVEKRIKKYKKKFGAESVSCTIIDAKTGEILSSASTPGVNPENFASASTDAFTLWHISSTYEPGSTFKSITAAILIEEGLVEPSTVFTLPPYLKVGDYKIYDAWYHGTIKMTLRDIIINSSNIGTVLAAQRISEEKYYEYLEKLGFTSYCKVDYPGSAGTQLADLDEWTETSMYNIPFGQGIALSGILQMQAYSAIVNDGIMTTPHFLVSCPDDDSVKADVESTQVFSKETSDKMADVLEDVAETYAQYGTSIDGYTIAGKTATAEVADTENGGYIEGSYIYSFMGYFPEADTDVLILTTVVQPTKKNLHSSEVSGVVFADIGEYCMQTLRVSPDC
jgi:cell division protein FtsI (penicillin-binding protein 3)